MIGPYHEVVTAAQDDFTRRAVVSVSRANRQLPAGRNEAGPSALDSQDAHLLN